jgi:dTDP-4-dehydrorhamnose 3,5-epimerase
MQFKATQFPDVILIEPQVFGDERGFFMETYQAERFAAAGIQARFVQDNHAGSHRNSLRGLHYQIRQAQGKLLRVVVGEIYDVTVDLRRSSATFGICQGFHLSAENKQQIWIPPGYAHGYYVISDWAELIYKTTDYYAPQWERTLLWNDPDLAIAWPIPAGEQPILSAKDRSGTPISTAEVYE